MKYLMIFNFETGDTSCRYWRVVAVVNCQPEKLKEIEDSFASYLESTVSDDKDYEDMVKDVLDAADVSWEPVKGKIPACDGLYEMFI